MVNGVNAVTREGFSAQGPPVANCKTYNAASSKEIGTVFYPLHDNSTAEEMRGGNSGSEAYNATLN